MCGTTESNGVILNIGYAGGALYREFTEPVYNCWREYATPEKRKAARLKLGRAYTKDQLIEIILDWVENGEEL